MANEKQVLIEALKKYHDAKFTPGVYEHSIFGKAALLLEKSVEVVRCKDCKHWYEPEETCLKIYSDGAVSAYAWQFRKPDDFCSYGERKDNGKE